MTFNAMIEKIMPDVNVGSEEPIIIYRDKNGDWHGDYTLNQYGEEFDWVDDIRENEPFAIIVNGADFAKGSYPYVYDKIILERFEMEYHHHFDDGTKGENYYLSSFMDDNIGELSHDVTDYLMEQERPLTAINEMLPKSLKAELAANYTDMDIHDKVIDHIENEVAIRLNNRSKEVMLEHNGEEIKINQNDYKTIQNQYINGREIILSENPQAEYRYMVCESKWDNPLGLQETIFTGLTNEYLEALEKYTDTVKYYVGCATSTRDMRKSLHGVEFGILTEKECVPNGMNDDLDGKVIIIKAEALSPQYQSVDYQLRFCNGGFGTRPNSRGRAVFCTDLFEDKKSRFEREDVLGVADISMLPEWAQKRIAELRPEKATPQKTASKKPSLSKRIEKGKEKVREADKNKDKAIKPKNKNKGVDD